MSTAKHPPPEENLLHSVPPEAAEKLYELEKILGKAYMLQDDLREILGLPHPAAKRGSDLRLQLQQLER